MTGKRSEDGQALTIRYGSFDTQEILDITGRDILKSAIGDFNNIEQLIRITGVYAHYAIDERRLTVVIDSIIKIGTATDHWADEGKTFIRATERNLKTLLRMRLPQGSIEIRSNYDLNPD